MDQPGTPQRHRTQSTARGDFGPDVSIKARGFDRREVRLLAGRQHPERDALEARSFDFLDENTPTAYPYNSSAIIIRGEYGRSPR